MIWTLNDRHNEEPLSEARIRTLDWYTICPERIGAALDVVLGHGSIDCSAFGPFRTMDGVVRIKSPTLKRGPSWRCGDSNIRGIWGKGGRRGTEYSGA